VSPRPGGEADKLGNRYELAWAVRHALECIGDESRSLTVEDVDPDLSHGSEFTYATSGRTEVHQLKRQRGGSNAWSITALTRLRIFDSAARHVAAGREFHFVSLIPAGPLVELSDRARRSADLGDFTQFWLTETLRVAFDQLAEPEVLGNVETAWTTLTQESVANAAGIDRSFYVQLEGGKRSISVERLDDLAAALSIDVAALFVIDPKD
jgi:DNA-binding XRE family transcriptional regulator